MKNIWLSKLKPDEVGQPYIDVRAHRSFWESVERVAQSKKAQLNDTLIGGNLSDAREITASGIKNICDNQKFFMEKYNLEIEEPPQ